jgi:hypothetical protein
MLPPVREYSFTYFYTHKWWSFLLLVFCLYFAHGVFDETPLRWRHKQFSKYLAKRFAASQTPPDFVPLRFDFVLRKSDFILRKFDFVLQKFDFVLRKSDFVLRKSDFVLLRFDFVLRKFDFVLRKSDFVLRKSDFVLLRAKSYFEVLLFLSAP